MSLFEIILTAISLSLDAVAVSIAAGAMRQLSIKQALKVGFFFGAFQGVMPLVGWVLGYNFADYFSRFGALIGFIALFTLGCKLLYESLKKPNKQEINKERHITETKILSILALTTSMDALVIGITFNFIFVNIPLASSIIGLITFLFCILGIYFGKKSRQLLGNRIEIVGAVILMLLAFKILLF
ncbi:MAG: hypothetical protein A3I29_04570 [Candidatus Magasanikbacteria bacterium RIFCSPLOWO2_02_FULL_44_11]|uniref:Putative manganese efflux pump MntP n=2 Tax=Candidatus Magasanikiibacteriota TaxID=1752731 RepID=A0A1F6N9G2_9BACT|nr:MAG: hypothetical protein A3D53_03720 [Candidatus Magasanikbacteria bacterium RIFCSPHIGHO2_02_FULL_45_10]OGH80509.1 MAG: hypothetical protein A3I29_04570 [Candidatus Magasanikbacteria bacterium RIFCSPLOWO2_02_FULL_44_11]